MQNCGTLISAIRKDKQHNPLLNTPTHFHDKNQETQMYGNLITETREFLLGSQIDT